MTLSTVPPIDLGRPAPSIGTPEAATQTSADDRTIAIPVDHVKKDGAPVVVPLPGSGPSSDTEWWTAVFVGFLNRISGFEQIHLLTADGAGWYRYEVQADTSLAALRAVDVPREPADGERGSADAGWGTRVIAGAPILEPDAALGGAALRLVRDEHGRVALAADGRCWTRTSVERMAAQLTMLAGADDPDRPIAQLNMLGPADRRQVLLDWNDSDADWPGGNYLDLLADRVAAAPDGRALVHDATVVTYGELGRRSDRIAHALSALGAEPGARVGLLARRSADFVVTVIGILKTGAAAVLLDPVNPDARLAYMVRDADPIAVLADDDQVRRVPEGVLTCALDGPEIRRAPDVPFPRVDIGPDTISHLIYTSGSTGDPKAVLEHHSALTNLVHWTGRAYDVRPGDRASWLSTPGFAVQFMECMPYLGLGIEVHVGDLEDRTPQQVRDWLVEHRITHTMLVAALAERAWALDWPDDTALRILVTTAERVHEWPPTDRPFTVVVTYGSTETTNVLTCLDIGTGLDLTTRATPPEVRAARPVPVGRPISNLRVYLLDAAGEPVPVGVVGRVHVAGDGVAAGYHNLAELTDAKFRVSTLPETAGEICYDTGDLARFRPDGAIELLGRGDAQVKIRGFRVELGEVETVIAAAPGVAEAVVTARTDNGSTSLVAYVALSDVTQDATSVRGYVARRLPHYMVPTAVVTLPALPRLANGKVDLVALPDPRAVGDTSSSASSASAAPPETDTQRGVAAIFETLFHLAEVGIDDSFFDLGGHSLLAFRLLDEVRTRFAAELSLPDLYAHPTVRGLAELIETGDRPDFGGVPPITPDPEHRYDPFPLTDSQQALWIGRGDAVQLGNVGCHGYFEWDSDRLEPKRFEQAWRRLVERHDALRTVIRSDGTQQVLREPGDYTVPVLDLRGRAQHEVDAELSALRERLSHQVMADDQWPLFDVRLTRMSGPSGDLVRLHLSLDFLISDAWSYFQVLIPDLVHYYDEPDTPLPPLELTFRDYVVSTRKTLPDSEIYRRSELYWLDRIDTLPPAPALPDRPADQEPLPIRFDRCAYRMSPEQWEQLKSAGHRHGVTPSMILASAFAEVIRARTGQPTFTLNFPLFNRLPVHPQVENVIGDTTTTLLLAAEKYDGTFVERAQALQMRLWTDLEHRYFSGVQVLRELNRRSGRMIPAMPVVMTSLLGHPPRHQPSALGTTVHSISQTPQVSVDFQVFEIGGELQFNWDYLPGLFPDNVVESMFAEYCAVLEELRDDAASWTRTSSAALGEPELDLSLLPAHDDAAHRDGHAPTADPGPAWERFWSGVTRTGSGGDVLWDPSGGTEIAETLVRAEQNLTPALPVVDVGCGNGRYTRAFATRFPSAVGVDVSQSAIEVAVRESVDAVRTDYRVLDITEPMDGAALGDEIGDANVFVRAVLHILDAAGREAAAETLAELAGRRGTVMLLEPNYPDRGFGYMGFVGGSRGRAAELVRPLEGAGVGSSSRFGADELARYFPAADGWEVVRAEDVEMDALDPESDQRTMRIPGFAAVVRRST